MLARIMAEPKVNHIKPKVAKRSLVEPVVVALLE